MGAGGGDSTKAPARKYRLILARHAQSSSQKACDTCCRLYDIALM